jgi:hypothetical protein
MTTVTKIDSNFTSLAIAEEQSIGVLPGTPVWVPMEPNDYSEFGGEITTIARRPINAGRQLQKGVVTDLNSSGGISMDVTKKNFFEQMQGFMFADIRKKGFVGNAVGLTTTTVEVTNATTISRVAGGISFVTEGFAINSIILCSGFNNAVNNGPFLVTAVTASTLVVTKLDGTAALLVAEAASSDVSVERVGHQFAAGDATIVAGPSPYILTTVKDVTTFGLVSGDWVFIGGDTAVSKFATAANNGFARVRVSSNINQLLFTKTSGTMVNDAGAAKTIQIYFGSVLKNESNPALIKRRTYQLERQLGAPDDAFPAQIQSEYLIGSVANKVSLDVPLANKLMAKLSYIGTDNEQRSGVTGVKSGTRPALVSGDAFNTSSDVSRIKLSVIDPLSANPLPLFAYITTLSIDIDNKIKPSKAVGKLGAFDMTAGFFEVMGSLTAYFVDVSAVAAVRNNADVTLDAHFISNNAGFSLDIPLLQLGKGRLNVKIDEAIMIPLEQHAASAAKFGMDHTLLFVRWSYLPLAAEL